jgi:steroid delta-isomerase-like uncharacterized protein
MSAEEVARSYFDAIRRHNLDDIESHYSPELVVDFIGQGIYRGPGEMRGFFEGLFAAMPDAEMAVERVAAEGEAAFVQWRLRGNFTGGPLFGIESTGKWIDQRGVDVVEVSGDKIVRNTAYQDGMEMARSIGMMPPADSPAERGMKQAFNLATKARRALAERLG